MNKFFLFLSLVIGISTQAQLTYGENEYAFNDYNVMVKLGVGLTPIEKHLKEDKDYATVSSTPTFSINVEGGFIDLGKGFVISRYIGVGARQTTIEINTSSPNVFNDKIQKSTEILVGVGVGLHKSFNSKFEIYSNIGASAGALKITKNDVDNIFDLKFRPSLGARYKFTDHIGVFAEGALGIENFRAGISFF